MIGPATGTTSAPHKQSTVAVAENLGISLQIPGFPLKSKENSAPAREARRRKIEVFPCKYLDSLWESKETAPRRAKRAGENLRYLSSDPLDHWAGRLGVQ